MAGSRDVHPLPGSRPREALAPSRRRRRESLLPKSTCRSGPHSQAMQGGFFIYSLQAEDLPKRFVFAFYLVPRLLATEMKEAFSTASFGTVSTSGMKLMVDVKDSSKNSGSTLHGPVARNSLGGG